MSQEDNARQGTSDRKDAPQDEMQMSRSELNQMSQKAVEKPRQQEAQEADEQDEDSPFGDFDPERVKAKLRKQNGELRQLRERAKQAEQKAETADEATKRADSLQQQNLRLEVALDLGLPAVLAKRLTGSTKEEILADAEDLMKLVGGSKPPTNRPQERLRSGGDPNAEPEETDLSKIGSRMFRP